MIRVDQERRKAVQDAIVRQNYKRKITNRIFTGVAVACVALALVPLGSILIEVVKNGVAAIRI